jgi:hypothetical protein
VSDIQPPKKWTWNDYSKAQKATLIGSVLGLLALLVGSEVSGWGREYREDQAMKSACARLARSLSDVQACSNLP